MDKEYIEREKTQYEMLQEMCGTGYQSWAVDIIKRQPIADVVEVVRCKDCKYSIKDTFKRTMCNRAFTMFEVQQNDFCSYGERKED